MVLAQNCAKLCWKCDNTVDFYWGTLVLQHEHVSSIDEYIRILMRLFSNGSRHRHHFDWHSNMIQSKSSLNTQSILETSIVQERSMFSAVSSGLLVFTPLTPTFQHTMRWNRGTEIANNFFTNIIFLKTVRHRVLCTFNTKKTNILKNWMKFDSSVIWTSFKVWNVSRNAKTPSNKIRI